MSAELSKVVSFLRRVQFWCTCMRSDRWKKFPDSSATAPRISFCGQVHVLLLQNYCDHWFTRKSTINKENKNIIINFRNISQYLSINYHVCVIISIQLKEVINYVAVEHFYMWTVANWWTQWLKLNNIKSPKHIHTLTYTLWHQWHLEGFQVST